MFRGLCDDTLDIVEQWTPKKKYSREVEYRDELMEFVRRELKQSQQDILFGTPGKHLVRKESGRHLADIGIDEDVGIELKLNLKTKAEINRLDGQVADFAREYSCIIIVLCGEVSDETVEELEYRFRQRYGNVGLGLDPQGPRVKVVRKDEASTKGKKKEKESGNISGFGVGAVNEDIANIFGHGTKKKSRKKKKDNDLGRF